MITTPTVEQISSNVVAQISSAISQAVPLLPKAFTRVLAQAIGAVFVLVYKYAGFSLLQMFVTTASAKDTLINGVTVNPLNEWGKLVGLGDRGGGSRWEGTIVVDVLKQVGVLPAGSQLLRSSTGVLYLTLSAVALDAPQKTITIRASSDQDGNGGAGALGNLNAGDIISFAGPQANVATDASVQSTAVAGGDAEEVEAYRARIFQRSSERPQGGAYADYRAWGEAVPGIVRVFPYTGETPGEVDVYVEATVASSGDEDGIPTLPQQLAVAAAIEQNSTGLAENRPAGAAVNVLPIARQPFDVVVTGLVATDPTATQATITTAVDELLRSKEPFIVGLSMLSRLDRITASSVAGMAEDAANAEGASISTVTISVGGSPVTAWTLTDGQRAKLNDITFA